VNSEDEVLCPFCGRDVWWEGENGPCEHLLADWASDPEGNAGGVLGEMLSRKEGIAGAEALARVSGKLCAGAWLEGEAGVELRLRLAASAVEGNKPGWWPVLDDAILDYDDPEAVLGHYGPDANIDQVGPTLLAADFANSVTEAVIQNLPGARLTHETLGGMASGDCVFVWSEDPGAGRAAIDAAMSSAIKTVQAMIATLDAHSGSIVS
jgi:hypothetical protein